MNVNMTTVRRPLEAVAEHRDIMQRAYPELVFGEHPVLVPDEHDAALGVYQVWWPVYSPAGPFAQFMYVTPDGQTTVRIDSFEPADFRS